MAWVSGIYEEVNKAAVDVIAEVCVLRAKVGVDRDDFMIILFSLDDLGWDGNISRHSSQGQGQSYS